MKISTRGIVAGALGLGLLAGGSTFALWSSTTDADAGKINTGNLHVAVAGAPVWTDVSADVAGAPVAIPDATKFKTVPGDTLNRTQNIDVTLAGDNINATLNVTSSVLSALGAEGETKAGTGGLSATYIVLDKNGQAVPLVGGAPSAKTTLGTPVTLKVPKNAGTTPDTYTVQIELAFDKTATDLTYANAQAVLGNVNFSLEQSTRG